MPDRETRVRYKALADFSALTRSVRRAKQAVKELREEEAKLNAQSAADQSKTTKAINDTANARRRLKKTVDDEGTSVRQSTARFVENAKAVRDQEKALGSAKRSAEGLAVTTEKLKRGADGLMHVVERNGKAVHRLGANHRAATKETDGLTRSMSNARRGGEALYRGLTKLGDWRPRLVPPFIALIPIIGGVLALLNPLVAGLGAVSMAAYALASSLGSALGGAIVGIIPGIATLIGLVSALKVAFGGIGGAFKAFSKMQNTGGGGGGRAKQEISDAEKLARAQQKYADATQDVVWAQEDLDEARKGYLMRLRDLQKAVDRMAMSEARAAANSQLARENYANVLADPGSTKGEKMDAQVGVDESQAEFQDTVEQNKQNAEDLAKMKRDGIASDREVMMSQRALTRALWAQRDAQIDLANEMSGANKAMAGGASAVDEYARMLAKLSPSARKFVETIVAMRKQWDALKRNVQESFFSEVVDDLHLIPRAFRPLESMLSNIAGSAGRVFSRFIRMVTGSDWLDDFETFGEEAGPVIEIIGDGLLSLLDSFRNITLAAMPFFKAMSEGFRDGAKDFSGMVEDARKSGSLAAWLEKSRQKLAQWWRIIKNIGSTLFNYSSAAEDFGGWMLDGLEGITKGWKSASEDAKKDGSPFKKYLEDIKPLLTEVKGLFGDFFKWFGREASDPDNIEMFKNIVHIIREDIGPALSKLFDTLSKTGIGEAFTRALGSIVELISNLAASGGADAMKTFFGILEIFFGALAMIAKIPGVGGVIAALATGLAIISGLTFVGKFSGLTGLLGLLLKTSKGGGVLALLKGLGSFLGIGGAVAVAGAAGTRRGPGGGATGAAAATGTRRGAGGGSAKAPAAGAKGGVRGGFGSSIGALLKGTTLLNIGLDFVPTIVGNLVSSIKGEITGGEASGDILKATARTVTFGLSGLIPGVDDFLDSVGEGVNEYIGKPVGSWLFNLFGGNTEVEEAEARAERMSVASKAMKDAQAALAASMDTLRQKQAEGKLSNDELLQALLPLTNSYIDQAQVIKDGGGTYQSYTGILQAGRDELVKSMVQMGFNESQARDLAGQIIQIPTQKQFKQYGNWSEAQKEAAATGKSINDIPNEKHIKVKTFWENLGDFFSFKWLFDRSDKKSGGGGLHNGGPVLKRAGGGGVPGSGNSDTVPSMLTPGEFVLRKAIVGRIGLDNLVKLNAGVMSYAEMLQNAMANQKGPSKKKQDSGFRFETGGLVPSMPPGFGGPGSAPPPSGFGGAPGFGGPTMTFGDIIINNPSKEPASDSLPRAIRKTTYLAETRR